MQLGNAAKRKALYQCLRTCRDAAQAAIAALCTPYSSTKYGEAQTMTVQLQQRECELLLSNTGTYTWE